MPGSELVQSLARGLDLLRVLAESRGGLRLTELVSATGLKRPTVHNLLRTLASRGFVSNDGGLCRLGPAIHMLAAEDASSAFLREAEAAVRALAARLPDAIINFCEPVGGEALVRFHQFPKGVPTRRPHQGAFSPYQTASGLALLAYADPETRQSVQMRHPFEVEGIGIWQKEERLEEFLADVRAKGFVLPPFCATSKFRLAAWPNLSTTGRLVGVLGVAWHVTPDAADDGTKAVLAALREAAKLVPATLVSGG